LTGHIRTDTSPDARTHTKTVLTSSFLLLLLLVIGAPAGAKCVFKKSCTRKAFKCFQPKGACT